MSQADAVKRIMDMAGMAEPIDFYITFPCRVEAAAYGDDFVARASTTIWDKPHLGGCLNCYMFLARVRDAEQLEHTHTGLAPPLKPMSAPLVPSKPRKGTKRPKRFMLADGDSRLAAANQAVTLAMNRPVKATNSVVPRRNHSCSSACVDRFLSVGHPAAAGCVC